ncbi:hypothetical protein ACFQU1_20510 [Chelatococcus sp. GCM10030263]|uniref:hypothetical protein n=1 Tax=Chelatococcus sp. GCM10030263 TaxID=3273387 RepID=UPI00362303CF
MATRVIIQPGYLAISRPGFDASSGRPPDMLLMAGIRFGQIIETGEFGLSYTSVAPFYYYGSGNFSRTYPYTPLVFTKIRAADGGYYDHYTWFDDTTYKISLTVTPSGISAHGDMLQPPQQYRPASILYVVYRGPS